MRGTFSVVLVSVGFSISMATIHSLIQEVKRRQLKLGIVQQKPGTSAAEK